MPGTTIEKGKTIYKSGDPLTALHVITKGEVQAEFPGGVYQLKKGDVIGIGEICSEIHFLGYTSTEESVLLTYPVNNLESLADLVRKHPNLARVFMLSLFRQINTLLSQSSVSEMNCATLHQNLIQDYKRYNAACARNRISPRKLEGLEDLSAYIVQEDPDMWLNSYYLGLQSIYFGEDSRILLQEPGISLGMLRKGSLDFRKTYSLLEEQNIYRTLIFQHYFNNSGNDLFDFYTSLCGHIGIDSAESAELYSSAERIIKDFEADPYLNTDQFANRITTFRNMMSASDRQEKKDNSQDTAIISKLTGSLNTILEYAGSGFEESETFRQHVNEFKDLADKNATDEVASRLRKRITAEFYDLYLAVFERSLSTSYIPAPVKMFLYFGYVDEDLAGVSNCEVLYNLAFGMEDQSKAGVYTFYHWLRAIYNGRKAPSRNEFDEDFTDYLHKQKAQGYLTASQASSMENDPMSRVKYEMQNMLPSVNRVTFGRISTFCPLFTEDNVLKDLKSSYISAAQIRQAFDTIRKIDYSAFYRESLDYDNIDAMSKEIIHLEFLPDVILAPNVGIRGVTWQEIEGKKRNSSGRMALSIFHMDDLYTSMVRLAGEFRWEMCKRIQGSRWNDVTERSLTSEYFDYVQFYRKNRDLSTEAKERVRTSLQRAKNSFKEMFVRDYIVWVLFEGNGSPRLNKVARKIMFTYCPFPASLMAAMAKNPLYSELLERRNILARQRIHRLEMLAQKIKNTSGQIPSTLTAEIAYVKVQV